MKEKMMRKFNKDGNSQFDRLPSLPRSLNIEVTSACNQSCMFCGFHSDHTPVEERIKPVFIDETLLERLIRQAVKEGVGYEELGFHMSGEPLLFKNLEKYIALAKELGVPYVFITTNGALATKERVKSLIDSGLDSIRFSFNGATEETYTKAHGKNHFQIALQNIRDFSAYVKETKAPIKSSVSCVVTKETLGEKQQVQELFQDLVEEVVFFPVLNLPKFFPQLVEEFDLKIKNQYEYTPCPSVFHSYYVSASGLVQPCCVAVKREDMVIADMNHCETFAEVWTSEKFQQMRDDFLNQKLPKEVCKNCVALNKHQQMILE